MRTKFKGQIERTKIKNPGKQWNQTKPTPSGLRTNKDQQNKHDPQHNAEPAVQSTNIFFHGILSRFVDYLLVYRLRINTNFFTRTIFTLKFYVTVYFGK